MSLDEKLQLLRQIKKICEDYGLGTEKWDKDAAQKAQEDINKLIPSPSNQGKGLWEQIVNLMKNPIVQKIFGLILSVVNFFAGKIPILGPILGFVSSVIDLFSDSITTIVFAVLGVIGSAAGLVADVATIFTGTAPAKVAITLAGLIMEVPEIGGIFKKFELLYILWPEFTSALIAINIIFSKILDIKDVFIMVADIFYIFLVDILHLDFAKDFYNLGGF